MLKCPQCGALHPIKINKINGLPRKNQREFCSESCFNKHYNSTHGYVRNPRAYKFRPRSSKGRTYHCCQFCGKEGFKVLDKKDKNTFCSRKCRGEAKSKVARERDALFRIGVHYDLMKATADEKASRLIAAERLRLSLQERRASRVCECCGVKFENPGMGRVRLYCSHECTRKSAKLNQDGSVRHAIKQRHRAKKKQRLPSWFGELDTLVWGEASRLVKLRRGATGIEWHADHMIPMSAHGASGLHVWNNCQVIPAKLNADKSNALVLTAPCEWLRSL